MIDRTRVSKIPVAIAFALFVLFSFGNTFAEMSETELRLAALEERMRERSKMLDWLDKLSMKIDLRLRHESLFRDEKNTAAATIDRHRQRIRFRIAGLFHMYEDLDVGFRFVTGSDDPLSTNQTLDDTFDTKGFHFDRGFATFRQGPATITGGKFGTPFYHSELVFDSDLSFEGATEQLKFAFNSATVTLILSQSPVEELSGSQNDPALFGYQGVVEQKFESGKAKVGVAFYDFDSIQGATLPNTTPGNTFFGGKAKFKHNYNLLNIIGEVLIDLGIFPVKVFGEYVQNVAPGVKHDEGWQAGFKVGKKVKKAGDWQAKYLYRRVESDAVFGNFSDSDFHEGGTNAKGSEIGLKVGLRKGVLLNFSFFITEAIRAGKADLNRLQGDLIFTF